MALAAALRNAAPALLALAEAVGEMRVRQAAGFDAEEGGDFGDFLADVYAAHRNLTGSDA